MILHVQPFGRPVWECRKEIFKGIIAAGPGPPYDLRGLLYLAPNERAVRMMRVYFLEALEEATGAKGCIPPLFQALNRFIVSKVCQSSRSRLVEGLERELVIEDICRKATGRMPMPGPTAAIGPSLAPLVCEALDKLYTYGADDRRLRQFAQDSLPLELLLEVKLEYEAWLIRHGLSDVSAARFAWRPGAGEFNFNAVILDGFYDADPVEMRVFKALGKTPESHLIVQAPGIRLDGSMEEASPYFGTDKLIKELCGGAEPGDDFSRYNAEAALVAGALFEGVPVRKSHDGMKALGSIRRNVTVAGALNPAEEVYFIARDIKESCLTGNGPALDRILVYHASASYLPLIKEAFGDYGIPFHISKGTPLTQSPVVASFLHLLSLPAERYSFSAMRRVFASPFIRLGPDGNRLEAFDAFARKEGITGGRQRWVKAADGAGSYEGDDSLIPPLRQLLSITGRLSGNRSIGAWAELCLLLLDDAGFTSAVEEYGEKRPGILAAFEALLKGLKRLLEYSAIVSGGMEHRRFLGILKRLLSEKRFVEQEGSVSGVRVLARQEVFSEPFEAVYACGLSDGMLPAPVRKDIFIPDSIARALGMPSSRESLVRDARLFMALMLGAGKTVLCYPESTVKGPASPSPYIRALEPFIKAGYAVDKKTICRPAEPEEALGQKELLRTLSLSAVKPEFASLIRNMPELARIEEEHADEGVQFFSPPEKKKFSVTELEEYLLCRFRYYHSRVLKSAPVEEPDEDIAPHEAGSAVHEILRDFYRQAEKLDFENARLALDTLKKIAAKHFEKLPQTFLNSELVRRFMERIAPRFIETEAQLSGGSFRVTNTEECVEAEIPDGEGGTIILTGKVDRVEIDGEGNFIVADYKTGKYPGNGKPFSKEFQLPLYAFILQNAGRNSGGPPPRPAAFVYYNLREGHMRDVVCYDAEVFSGPLRGTPARRKKSREQIGEMLKKSVDDAVAAAKGILSGDFSPNCEDAFVCKTCSYLEVCRKGAARVEDDAEGGVTDED